MAHKLLVRWGRGGGRGGKVTGRQFLLTFLDDFAVLPHHDS